jgi:pimeloyl-ACP methyl ester carboxylesterase
MVNARSVGIFCFVVSLAWSSSPLPAQTPGQSRAQPPLTAPPDAKPMSPTLEDVPYPYPVHYLPLTIYGRDVRMAYMDVPAGGQAKNRTVVLLHGMNFYGEYWAATIEALRKEGFRVVVPDQVGFGRSSKPVIPYTLSDMASNTRTILETVGIQKAAIVGHSMGGMVAARFALLYPEATERLVLYNQIGLTDARLQRPPASVDQTYKQLLNQSYDAVYRGIARYFVNGIPPQAQQYVLRQYGWTLSGNWPEAAMVRALVQQMVYEDPVVYDWPHIKAQTLEIGGDKDGPNFPELAKHVADTIPNCRLVLIPNVGHVPHFESPDVFHRELVNFLK